MVHSSILGTIVTFLYSLKTSGNYGFSNVFKGYKKCDIGLKWVKMEHWCEMGKQETKTGND